MPSTRTPRIAIVAALSATALGCGAESAADAADALAPPTAAAPLASSATPTLDLAKRDVPYVPTPQNVVDRMLELAAVGPDDIVYDLGSGDGRIVISAARDRGARGVGIDIDPERIAEAEENARRAGVTDRVRFIQGDLFEADVREATAVTLYLLRTVNRKLRPRLLEQLRPGTPVVSHDFDMTEWEPDHYERLDRSEIYLWYVPAKVEGTWLWNGPDGRPRSMRVSQQFQRFTATSPGGAIYEPRLRGDEISFTMRERRDGREVADRYQGRVNGSAIEGSVSPDGGPPRPWRATITR